MIDCLSVFYKDEMAATQVSSVKSRTASRSFTRALAKAFSEWLLIFMLFVNAIFSYLITKFADYSELQQPCLLCSRLDHILGKKRLKHHWDLICSKHKSEISSLVYCHAHDKLVDVHGMCETCLFSFATINKSNAETYRLLVGKLGENSCFGLNNDSSHGSVSPITRPCTCCNQPWVPRAYTQVAEPEVPIKIPSVGYLRSEKEAVQARDIRKKKVGFNHLPHVGYSELKIHSDTESEAVFSDDEEGAGMYEEEHHMFETVELESRVITLPYDLATDKLIDPFSASEPLISVAIEETGKNGHGLEELKLQETGLTMKSASNPHLISLDGMPGTSDKVFPEKELISFNDIPLTSKEEKSPAKLRKEREPSFPHYNNSLADFMEHPADVSYQLETHETSMSKLTETEFVLFNDVPSALDAGEMPTDVLNRIECISLNDSQAVSNVEGEREVLKELTSNEIANEVLKESETKVADDIYTDSEATKEISLEVSKESETKPANDSYEASEGTNETSLEALKESETKGGNDIYAGSEGYICESMEPIAEVPTINCEAGTVEIKETDTAENNELHLVRDENSTTQSATETIPSLVPSVSEMPPQAVPSVTGAALESKSSSVNSTSVATESNPSRRNSLSQRSDSLDLSDAYKIALGNAVKQQSSEVQTEQCSGKDSSRISEDLKALLTQISASRGIELLSPRDISPKISINSEDMKNFDDMQLLLQKRLLERNESNLSLDGVTVNEIEGESETDRLKRQVDHDRKMLTGLYKELEEERSASAVAANQAMAMITRLQEDKASFQMEALQNLRMMEEQAEYDMEALQKLSDLLAEREKVIQDLEAELEFYRSQSPSTSTIEKAAEHHETSMFSEKPVEFEKENVAEKASEVESPHKRMSNMIQYSLLGFEDERLYITDCLEKIEKKLHLFSNHGIHTDISKGECTVEGEEEANDLKHVNGETDDNHQPSQENVSYQEKSKDMGSVEDEVSELHERLERLKGDLYFLEHVINSLGHGNEGVLFVKEIASHLKMLRSLSMRERDETVS
ncbi:PREDICTED: myosin-binding protein 1-like [Tarenaya hassleriana]|uniref:myosin-binding protein 1-like n=1 Tax=Tarenaya hassleriana TaxID=28532 RepID=UPI00053C6CFC|nr:PREDICTED: myosin-binding protein 1-like [Tarenaya hassleriana]